MLLRVGLAERAQSEQKQNAEVFFFCMWETWFGANDNTQKKKREKQRALRSEIDRPPFANRGEKRK